VSPVTPGPSKTTALTLLQSAGGLTAADVARVTEDLHLDIRGGSEVVGRIRPTVAIA
jgi:hypothetical protein